MTNQASQFPHRTVCRVLMRAVAPILLAALVAGCGGGFDIQNPYASVDWESHGQYKANLHTHTTHSDGRMHPHMVVDHYHSLGYKVLAITDHNAITYPWTGFSNLQISDRSRKRMEEEPESMPTDVNYEDRDPEALAMIAVQGNELSLHHHIGSFFNDHLVSVSEDDALQETAAKNGIAMLYHPGRYEKTVEWYVDLYQRFDHLFGLEVYNAGNRYPKDRELWDAILEVTMPDRPVWGYSNDDMHAISRLGFNWNMLLMPELTSEGVRRAMEQGLSYFVYAPGGHDGPAPPVIESIRVDAKKGAIEINASGCESVAWISGGDVVHTGNTLDLRSLPKTAKYVRAELYGAGDTVVGTQPFGIR